MVRLFRGVARGRGRQIGRPPFMNLPMIPRQMRPNGFEPEIPPFVRTPMGRGRMPRPGPPRPLRLPLPPRMALGPPPLRPPLPPYPEVPHHMRPPLGIRPGMPPIHHSMPMIPRGHPHRRPMRTGPRTDRGRGMLQRGVGLKRLGSSANGKVKKPQKRKEKTEGQFFCEGCDKGWKTQEQLDSHLAEHQVCERDGCSFTAHPKILLKHVQLQHDTGLYLRILRNNPHDVEKWIAERKSRFPTKENVAKSKAQKEEMVDRGERIPKQEKRFQNRDNFVSWKRKHQGGNSKPNSYAKSPRHSDTKGSESNFTTHKWRDPEAWKGDLPRFAGTSAFPKVEVDPGNGAEDGVQFSDEEDVEEPKIITPTKVVEKPQLSGVLAVLAADYGSDMSEDDTESCINPGDISNNTNESTIPKHEGCLPEKCPNKQVNTSSVQEDKDSDSGPEERVVDREDKSNIPILTAEKENEVKSNENRPKQEEQKDKITQVDPRIRCPVRQPFRPKQPFTLLEKLLKNEIRHERNVILQCVRYVVKANFLGNGSLAK